MSTKQKEEVPEKSWVAGKRPAAAKARVDFGQLVERLEAAPFQSIGAK
jgi:hypothetical protein